jgi:hypothetical protein
MHIGRGAPRLSHAFLYSDQPASKPVSPLQAVLNKAQLALVYGPVLEAAMAK